MRVLIFVLSVLLTFVSCLFAIVQSILYLESTVFTRVHKMINVYTYGGLYNNDLRDISTDLPVSYRFFTKVLIMM